MEHNQFEIKNDSVEFSSFQYRGAIFSLIFVFGIGSLIPLAEMPFEKRYQVREPQVILASLQERELIEQSGFSEDDLLEFLTQPNAMIVEGRALYPRYYRSGIGEPDLSTHYRYLDYSRLVFTIIGPYAGFAQGVVIAGDKPNFDIHISDAIVLGCWNTTYYAPFLDAVIVFVISDEGNHIYLRSPEHPLQCPLAEPFE
jgi:hypothetical protein